MGITTCPIRWNKAKTQDRFEAIYGDKIKRVVYGGYANKTQWRKSALDCWHVMVRVDKASPPNKLIPGNSYKKLSEAQDGAVTAGLMFFALCLIRNKLPRDMPLYDYSSIRGI